MKTIGLIGGMSWESTALYYRLLNEMVKSRLGGHHSAQSILYSVDFAAIEIMQREGRWQDTADVLSRAAVALQSAGADFILLCTNTMHIVAPQIQQAVNIPLIHIVDPTARAIKAAQIGTVGLLGTRFTMEQSFYIEKLQSHGLNVLLPEKLARDEVHRVIYEELVHGKIVATSRGSYLAVIEELKHRGAEAVIFGCTEIALLLPQSVMQTRYFDTTELHVRAAVEAALAA